MASTIGNVYIRIGADTKKLTGDLKAADRQIQAFGKKAREVGSSMTQNVTLPIIGIGAGALKAYADIEALQKGLIAVMGSSSAASAEFEKLKEVAKLPGLGLEEAAQGSVSLQSAGFSADQAREALLQFGNALATVGKGKNELNLVVLALTQLQNKSSGFGQDLRQLLEQLPQMRTALVDAFGTADSEEIAKMGVTGKQVVEQLMTEFAKLPRVTGGLKNSFENASDSIKIAFANLGESLNKSLDIEGVINGLADSISNLAGWFSGLSSTQQKLIITFAGVVAAIGPLTYAIGTIATSFSSVIAAIKTVGAVASVSLGPVGIAIAAITAALGVGVIAYNAFGNTAVDAAKKEKNELEDLVKSAKKNIDNTNVRSALYDEIKKKYPDYLKNIDLEKEGIDGLNKVLETYNNSNTLAAAREKDKQMEIIELQKKKADLIKQIIQEEKRPSGTTGLGFTSKDKINIAQGQIDVLDKKIKELGGGAKPVVVPVKTETTDTTTTKFTPTGNKKDKTYGLADLRKELAQIDNLVKSGFLPTADALDDKLGAIEGAAKKFAEQGLKPTSKEFQTLKDLSDELVPRLAEDIGTIPSIDQLNNKLSSVKDRTKEVQKEMEGIGKKIGITFKTAEEITAEYWAKLISKAQESIKKVTDAMNKIGAVLNPALELGNTLLENQMIGIDQKQQKEKAAVEASILNEDEKKKRIAQIDEKYDKERKKIQRKQAIAAKVSGVFNALISAFVGAAKALELGPIGLTLSPIIKGLGIANAAAIAAQPLPSLAIGTSMVKSDGLAQIHKGEAIVPAKVVGGGFGAGGSMLHRLEAIIEGHQLRIMERNAQFYSSRLAGA